MPGNIWLILPRSAAKEAATGFRLGVGRDFDKGLRNSEKQSAAKRYMIGCRRSFEVSRAHAATSAGLASARLLANRRGLRWNKLAASGDGFAKENEQCVPTIFVPVTTLRTIAKRGAAYRAARAVSASVPLL